MPKHALIAILLDIPAVHGLQTEWTKAGEHILTVESTLNSTSCRRWGRTITEPHGLDQPRLLRHLPILGRSSTGAFAPSASAAPSATIIPLPRRRSTGMTRTRCIRMPTSAT